MRLPSHRTLTRNRTRQLRHHRGRAPAEADEPVETREPIQTHRPGRDPIDDEDTTAAETSLLEVSADDLLHHPRQAPTAVTDS